MSSHLQQVALLLMAQAQPEGGAGGCAGGGGNQQMILMAVMLAILYFVWIRPGQAERKKHQSMIDQLKRGDEVITNSGIFGTITDMDERTMTLEVARNVKIKVLRTAISKNAAELKAAPPKSDKPEKADKAEKADESKATKS
jgi:preprotein translocase subunit YajC